MPNQLPLEIILQAALEIPSLQERAAYLDDACGGDPALQEEAESLIAAHFEAETFMDTLANPVWSEVRSEKEGDTIGRYKLIQQIGEGGFGTIYLAEQSEPVKRQVALKVIKPGMDSKEIIARFEAERQALAMMNHPHIAKVYDAGTTGAGRPYFVMELVDGVPITKYCSESNLDAKERLELFTEVCAAVQHAHQKGIIHRDLKPSNLLVSLHDGKPVVKVIDFGIAKAIGMELTEKTAFTQFGRMIGTPQYMSPEQAELNALDVDTRSDI
jgi:serine/threonine-protein kinase